jgi:hypothetical protein
MEFDALWRFCCPACQTATCQTLISYQFREEHLQAPEFYCLLFYSHCGASIAMIIGSSMDRLDE